MSPSALRWRAGIAASGKRSLLLMDALAAARKAGLSIQVVRSYVNLMFIGATLREHECVDRVVDEAQAFCEEHDAPIPRHAIECSFARSLLDRGRWDEALRAAVRSLRMCHSELPRVRGMEGVIAARRGEPGAERTLADAWRSSHMLPRIPATAGSAAPSSKPRGCAAIARLRSSSWVLPAHRRQTTGMPVPAGS